MGYLDKRHIVSDTLSFWFHDADYDDQDDDERRASHRGSLEAAQSENGLLPPLHRLIPSTPSLSESGQALFEMGVFPTSVLCREEAAGWREGGEVVGGISFCRAGK